MDFLLFIWQYYFKKRELKFVKLKKLLNLTKKGEILNNSQINSLAVCLGLRYSTSILIFKSIISIGILSISLMCFLKINNLVLNLIIFCICIILIILLFLINTRKKNILIYLETLKEFYLKKFNDFEGMESTLVRHQFQKNGYLQNDLAILITDGYDFYIFDDILKETEYKLPKKYKSNLNKKPMLKVFNPEFLNKRPVHFKLNEIAYYSLVKPFVLDKVIKTNLGNDYFRFTYINPKFELDNYCLLLLEDGSTFKLGEDVVTLLRKKALKKERS
jgi:hypothetical protein